MCVGSEFQVDGAETENVREVKLLVMPVGLAHERYRRQTDRQTTDGRAIAYSEREREFTFAKNKCSAVG